MRIGIVNDVAMASEVIRQAVLHHTDHEVAWLARDGLEAVENCRKDRPDLVLMDLIMPRMDGVEATRRIMLASPCPVVIVTASVRGNCSKVFEAMGAGAIDAVNTPDPGVAGSWSPGALLDKIDIVLKLTGTRGAGETEARKNGGRGARPLEPRRLVVAGASAGGPAAVAAVLGKLSPGFPAPILLVQHVDAQFAPGLAEWLDSQTPLKVRLAREGDRPQAGEVLLAGNQSHLVFTGPARLGYTRRPVNCAYRPSIDVFFQSVATHWRGEAVAILFTGMGRDGVEGLRALRLKGHVTLTQDQNSSAVFGMPKTAAETGAASEILSLDKIANRLTNIMSHRFRIHG